MFGKLANEFQQYILDLHSWTRQQQNCNFFRNSFKAVIWHFEYEIGQAGETSQRLREIGFYTSVKTDFHDSYVKTLRLLYKTLTCI